MPSNRKKLLNEERKQRVAAIVRPSKRKINIDSEDSNSDSDEEWLKNRQVKKRRIIFEESSIESEDENDEVFE